MHGRVSAGHVPTDARRSNPPAFPARERGRQIDLEDLAPPALGPDDEGEDDEEEIEEGGLCWRSPFR